MAAPRRKKAPNPLYARKRKRYPTPVCLDASLPTLGNRPPVFLPQDRVQHIGLGFRGRVVRPDALDGLPGYRVVWDEDVWIIDVAPGEEIWYPALVLTKELSR